MLCYCKQWSYEHSSARLSVYTWNSFSKCRISVLGYALLQQYRYFWIVIQSEHINLHLHWQSMTYWFTLSCQHWAQLKTVIHTGNESWLNYQIFTPESHNTSKNQISSYSYWKLTWSIQSLEKDNVCIYEMARRSLKNNCVNAYK